MDRMEMEMEMGRERVEVAEGADASQPASEIEIDR